MTERAQTPPQETPLRMTLPETLDLRAATPLASTLLAARGAALTLDASQVASVGAQCVQVILSAKLTWRRDGQPFAIVDKSVDQFLRH